MDKDMNLTMNRAVLISAVFTEILMLLILVLSPNVVYVELKSYFLVLTILFMFSFVASIAFILNYLAGIRRFWFCFVFFPLIGWYIWILLAHIAHKEMTLSVMYWFVAVCFVIYLFFILQFIFYDKFGTRIKY